MFPWKSFPFNGDFTKISEQMGPKDVHSYVNELIEKFIPQNLERYTQPADKATEQNGQLQPTIFESLDDVYIKLSLSDNNMTDIKISHTSNQVIVENILEAGKREYISLPCPVSKKGGSAKIEDGILQIKLPKNIDTQYTELTIKENNI
ncbi:Hsp20/alpha crystallin family protein [Bacillus sp. FJAT-50079]|uniref:Hsp20/alpha crystallin family protein n=1 Tax=Bacillus sp. FJAT-50079 TaxID=2833577 RepID=UPI001BC93CF8|nr:Hsp20/alpha crystallin family protein [Bacillus sp. FJAT-50079]MBS4209882.1 Hsp20/alpha crystallin family protein [Bacillus sp. FJAT-50079]